MNGANDMKRLGGVLATVLLVILSVFSSTNKADFIEVDVFNPGEEDIFKGYSIDTPLSGQVDGEILRVINIALLKWIGACDKEMDNILVEVHEGNDYYYVDFVDKTISNNGVSMGKSIRLVIIEKKTLKIVSSHRF